MIDVCRFCYVFSVSKREIIHCCHILAKRIELILQSFLFNFRNSEMNLGIKADGLHIHLNVINNLEETKY